jgi:polysaccharide biosynthesis/export protein
MIKKCMWLMCLAISVSLGACSPLMGYVDIAEVSSTATPYTLASGDRLRIIVFGQDNLSNIYQMDGSGKISMPLIGDVILAGRTTLQSQALIAERLRNGFIREPKVTVEVESYRPFFILGEVTNSGQFAYVNGMNIQKAVAIAGGFTPRAAQNYAEVTRKVNGKVVSGKLSITSTILPGDTITIKERWF